MTEYLAVWQDVVADRSFELDRLIDGAGELRIDLSDNAGRKILVKFDSHLCYRRIDEGDALIIVEDLEASVGASKVFYKVENSEFMSWFHVQSREIYLGRALHHFAICTSNDIIDVIALGPPVIDAGG